MSSVINDKLHKMERELNSKLFFISSELKREKYIDINLRKAAKGQGWDNESMRLNNNKDKALYIIRKYFKVRSEGYIKQEHTGDTIRIRIYF